MKEKLTVDGHQATMWQNEHGSWLASFDDFPDVTTQPSQRDELEAQLRTIRAGLKELPQGTRPSSDQTD